jgi:hypothetical protein
MFRLHHCILKDRYRVSSQLCQIVTEEVKVKFTLEQATNAQRGVDVYLYSFFNLGRRWVWMVSATPRPLYPQERTGTVCIGGWMDPMAGLDG